MIEHIVLPFSLLFRHLSNRENWLFNWDSCLRNAGRTKVQDPVIGFCPANFSIIRTEATALNANNMSNLPSQLKWSNLWLSNFSHFQAIRCLGNGKT